MKFRKSGNGSSLYGRSSWYRDSVLEKDFIQKHKNDSAARRNFSEWPSNAVCRY